MEKETFVIVMRVIHDALFKMHAPASSTEQQILNELINTYISMIAGFHQWLYEELRIYLLSHPNATDDDFAALYEMMTVSPVGGDQ